MLGFLLNPKTWHLPSLKVVIFIPECNSILLTNKLKETDINYGNKGMDIQSSCDNNEKLIMQQVYGYEPHPWTPITLRQSSSFRYFASASSNPMPEIISNSFICSYYTKEDNWQFRGIFIWGLFPLGWLFTPSRLDIDSLKWLACPTLI